MTSKISKFSTLAILFALTACDQAAVEHGSLSGYPGAGSGDEWGETGDKMAEEESGEGWGESGESSEEESSGESSEEESSEEESSGESSEEEEESTEEESGESSEEESSEEESGESSEEESERLPAPDMPCGEIEGLGHSACPVGYVCETLNIGCVPYEPPDHPCFIDLQTAHDIRKANGVSGACILQDGKTCKEHLDYNWTSQTCPGNFFPGTCLEASQDEDPLWNWNIDENESTEWIGSCVDSNYCEHSGEVSGVAKHGIIGGAISATSGLNFFPSPEMCATGSFHPHCK